MPTDLANTPDELFETFVNAQTFKTILNSFDELCRSLRIDRKLIGYGRRSLYKVLTNKLTSWKSKSLWAKIDKRGAQKEYENGNVCADMKVCIVGAGPVGLRLAIECALLGARCIVVEKRDRFSRHNVLHLWPYVMTDLRNLGAKVFYGKFAIGQIDHISIRQLQCILLKIALVVGVEIYPNVTFIDAIEPISAQHGWRAHFKPENHPIMSTYEFNVLIGADGLRNSLQGFQHKEFRGKLAIGVTCNFINHQTREEQNFEEISGVAKIYNPQFFNELQQQTSIDLENIVYYKDDTHYFVMTAKKQSLLDKGVILQDYPDPARLLARENVNFTQLCNFACEAARFSTKCSSEFQFEFAEDHHGAADVQMFDFTSLFHAVNSSRIVERHGKQVFMALVGDSLLESFWPRGSGIGLGFFGLYDTAWAILKFGKREHALKVLVERESIYNLLSQSTPENTKTNHQLYSINPASRYQTLNSKSVTVDEIRHLYDSDNIPTIDMNNNHVTVNKSDRVCMRRTQSFKESQLPVGSSLNGTNQQEHLLQWCADIIDSYSLSIKDDTKSFENSLAFCAIVHYHRPDLIDFKSLQSERPISNFQILFDIMHDQLSLDIDRKLQNTLILSMKSAIEERIRQSANTILQLLYTHFHHEQPLQRRRSQTTAFDVPSLMLPITSKNPINEPNVTNKRMQNNTNGPNAKVSALVAHYSNSDASLPTINPHALIGLQSERAPTFCFYCKEKVSIQDWFVVEKNVLHVKCFKCDTCQLPLRKTNYQVLTEPYTGKISFHCRYHNLTKQQKDDENKNPLPTYYDQNKQPLSFDETSISKNQKLVPSRHIDNTTADERVSFSLVKETDDDKEEIVYSSTSNVMNDSDEEEEDDDDDDESLPRTDGNSANSSSEKITDEEDEVDNGADNEQEENNDESGDDDAVNKLEESKRDSIAELSKQNHDRNRFVQQNQYLSIDSGHIQSESSSPIDLSPASSTSPSNQQIQASKKADPITFSYFRAPCPVCRGSTYDETSTIEIGRQYYHKACLRCNSCDKILRENEYNYHDLSSDGRFNFYCTLHFCKSRLKQVTATLALATEQESKKQPKQSKQSNNDSNTQWDANLRLYPSLNDALSTKPHPLNVVNIVDNKKAGHEHAQSSSISNNNHEKSSSSTFSRSKTFNESLLKVRNDNDENSNKTTDNSTKHRFKRREQHRRKSPTLSTTANNKNSTQSETNLSSIINRKKKKVVPKSNLNLSSSSSQSLDEERQHASNERRRQREERQKELIRFRRSQEIQRELEEIEQKRLELDKRHSAARENLNSALTDPSKKSDWERECLRVVRERTALQRAEDELLINKHALTLENERARAENEYRQLINLPDEQKTIKDKEREEQLITMIAKFVERKNNLTVELDQMRLREIQEDECLHQAFQLHGIEQRIANFHLWDTLNDIV